ncbi:MAG: hypothetical protein K1X83_15480, partial [Oligoflexia bacterium]|nr:hypothetical protein [Oligoflexia bacterium]
MNPSVVAKSQGAEDRQPEPAAELLAEAALSPLSGGEVNEFEASVGSKIGIGASSAEESLAAQLNSANPSQFSLAIGRCRALGERIPESDVLALSNYILSSMNRDHALEALAVLQTLGDRGRPAFEVLWNAGRFYLFEEAKTGPTLRGDLKGAIIGWGQNGQRFLIEKLQSGVPEHRSEAAAALVEGFAGSAEVELAVKQWIIDCAMRSEPHGVSASLCFLNGWFSPELSKFKLPEISAIDHDPIFRRVVIKMLWEVGSDYQGTAPRAADARNALKELGPEALVILPELEELLSSFVVKGLPYYLNGAQRVWNGLPTSDPPRSDWNDSAIKDLLRLYRDLTEMEGRASGSDGRKKTLELLTNLATADVPVEAA